MNELIQKMLAGDVQSLSRLITLIEREASEVPEIMRKIHRHTGRTYCVGVTGPPGGGKSSLVDRLTSIAREKGLSVGIVAVDPTSPFSGGALLGDRIRMGRHYLDKGVFIRSMATRGSQGGLPRTIRTVIRLLDACGKDIIFVETVGVGQTELDIIEAADTIVVVLVPEAGDTIQTMKAGLMEISDIFVVNKADRPGADALVADLEVMLQQSPKQSCWQVPVIAAQAINNIGIEELYQSIETHRRTLEESGQLALRRQEQRKIEFLQIIEQTIKAQVTELLTKDNQREDFLLKVVRGELDPCWAAKEVLASKVLLKGTL